MTVFVEGRHAGEHLVSEIGISREVVTIALGQNLPAGQVLGKITIGAATAAVFGSNTGNGVFGAVTVGAAAQPGVYAVKIIEAAANGGKFQVVDPQGDVVGIGTVGAAFSGGGLSFTIADGATDFVAGDSWTVTVAAGSGEYVAWDPAGTDGRQHAVAILFAPTNAADAAKQATVHARATEVKRFALTWKTGATTPQIAAATAELAAAGVIIR